MRNRNAERKRKERIILSNFIQEYNGKILILTLSEAKKKFPNFNEENPDFIIKIASDFKGVEVFELSARHTKDLLLSIEERKENIVNLPHLHSKRKKTGVRLLYPMPDLAKVAVERINEKIKQRVKNYVTPKIWLLGCACESYNFAIIHSCINDGIQDKTVEYIQKNIVDEKRVEKIFLFGMARKKLILEIK